MFKKLIFIFLVVFICFFVFFIQEQETDFLKVFKNYSSIIISDYEKLDLNDLKNSETIVILMPEQKSQETDFVISADWPMFDIDSVAYGEFEDSFIFENKNILKIAIKKNVSLKKIEELVNLFSKDKVIFVTALGRGGARNKGYEVS